MPRLRLTRDGDAVLDAGPKGGRSGSAAWSGGSSRRWRRLRAAVLARDRHACRRCGMGAYPGHELEAHHVIPRGEGGPDTMANLVTLGRSCHDAADAEARRRRRPRPANPIGRILT